MKLFKKKVSVLTVNSIWGWWFHHPVARIFPGRKWLDRFIWFFASVFKILLGNFWHKFHDSSYLRGLSRDLFSTAGKVKMCVFRGFWGITQRVFNVCPWIFFLQQDFISLLPQTSKVLVEVVWMAWKIALKLEFWPFFAIFHAFRRDTRSTAIMMIFWKHYANVCTFTRYSRFFL